MFAPSPWLPPVEFTAWATAVAGIGTVSAVVAAVIGFRLQSNQTRLALAQSQEQLDRERDRQRMRQAAQVAAWVEPDSERPSSPAVNIRNGSELPIHRVLAVLGASKDPIEPTLPRRFREIDLNRTGPGSDPSIDREGKHWLPAVSVALIPPGTTCTAGTFLRSGPGQEVNLELVFADASGRFWRRSGLGELLELTLAPAEHFGIIGPVPWDTNRMWEVGLCADSSDGSIAPGGSL